MERHGIKTLLVGIDFSKYSNGVVRFAKRLAVKLNVPLVYIHVFEDPVAGEWTMATVLGQLTQYYENQIRTRYVIKENEEVIVRCGHASQNLISVAKKFPSPLLIVGQRGKKGRTVQHLALQSPVPVWIHRGRKNVLPEHILVPSDLTSRSFHAIEGLKALHLREKLDIELYHVLRLPVPALDYHGWSSLYGELKKHNAAKMKIFKKKYGPLKVVETDGDVSDEIEKHSRKFDLIAITPRKHKGFFSSFGSVTSQVARQGSTSVLVVP